MIAGLRRAGLWLWSAPGNLVGLAAVILLSLSGHRLRTMAPGYAFGVHGWLARRFYAAGWGGVTLSGLVTLVWRDAVAELLYDDDWAELLRHEAEHRVQATYLGILYLPVYGAIWLALLAWHRSAAMAYDLHPLERMARE